ncbi:hypothetical protein TM239_50050 [Bradyrhizobium sp. TM239]|nr:hypothetical protein TM239_50050 [Bradyrhizobium sp. TM239]
MMSAMTGFRWLNLPDSRAGLDAALKVPPIRPPLMAACHGRRNDDILPLFCPTGQIDFEKSKNRNPAKGAATVHGVVFAFFVCRPPMVRAEPDPLRSEWL